MAAEGTMDELQVMALRLMFFGGLQKEDIRITWKELL